MKKQSKTTTPPTLLGRRVQLEPWRKRHMEQSLHVMRDKALFDFTNMPYPYKRKHGLDFLKRMKKGTKEGTDIVFAIVLQKNKKNKTLIGVCGVNKIDKKNKCAEMGYWISKEERGKGYATEATHLVVDYMFKACHLHRLEIRCSTINPASRKVIKKLGGVYEGTLRKEKYSPIRKAYHDMEVYGILQEEWWGR